MSNYSYKRRCNAADPDNCRSNRCPDLAHRLPFDEAVAHWEQHVRAIDAREQLLIDEEMAEFYSDLSAVEFRAEGFSW